MIETDLQSLAPGALIMLFDLNTEGAGESGIFRFHPGVNGLNKDIVWNGDVYTRFPIEAEGFDKRSSGTLPRPKIKVANVGALVGALVHELHDLVGATITVTRTLAKYLDAVNFPDNTNPNADPAQYIDRETWKIDRKAEENPVYIEFELAAAIDMPDCKLPRRQVIQNTCGWLMIGGYRGSYCGYTGEPVADRNDQPVESMAEDKCGGRLSSCKLRFDESEPLPYGGFPAAGLIR
ncbi:MAG: phage minor tail protein L [Zoogloeaceae bacterium]|jgi:lambda family phage minor tail protein L|nr:phage minor tail protein L [Zoogloeaceae bacterium]